MYDALGHAARCPHFASICTLIRRWPALSSELRLHRRDAGDGLQSLQEVRLRGERSLLPGLEARLRELRARAKWLLIYIYIYT